MEGFAVGTRVDGTVGACVVGFAVGTRVGGTVGACVVGFAVGAADQDGMTVGGTEGDGTDC